MENKLHFKKLDALRFFAFFLVFWQHGFASSFSSLSSNNEVNKIIQTLCLTGGLGVHIFFVISGFLITFLMIKEEEVSGEMNLKFFYVRRVLRIWPLYYLVMILGIFVLPHLFNTFHFSGSAIKNLLFLNNFDEDHSVANVSIAWSVAIEEQFYLFWPVLFILFRNKLYLFTVSISLFILSTVYIIQNPVSSYFHTLGNINFLMTGCMGAILYAKYKMNPYINRFINLPLLYLAVFIAILVVVGSKLSGAINYISLIVLPLTYIYTVINLVHRNNDASVSMFSKLGKYTYGMYLYHPLIIIFSKIAFDFLKLSYRENAAQNFLLAILSLTLTIGVSIISYEYFEKKILKFKAKFSFVKTRV